MNIPATPLTAGLHYGIPAALYHSDPCPVPSLNSGIVRTLVAKTPAHAYLEHPRLGGKRREQTPDMLLGGAVHAMLAGEFECDFLLAEFDNYQTKLAREWRDNVIASGKTPILRHTATRAEEIAKAIREKSALGITHGPFGEERDGLWRRSEVTAIWQHDNTWFRARFDRLVVDEHGMADIWDWKVTGCDLSSDALTRTIIDKGYDIQAAHYLAALEACRPDLRGRCSFILVFVESEPPYAVRRVGLSEGFLSIGRELRQRAIGRWNYCMQSQRWPDESAEAVSLNPPAWYAAKMECEVFP